MTAAGERNFGFILTAIRLFLGAVCFLNGLNWFFKIITPYPSMSDFVNYLPPPDIVGALIENGILFNLAKAVELVTGLAFLTNRFVPLSLIVSMSVTVTVFIVDVFKPEFRLRAFLMGTGTMAMTVTLLIAYFDNFRPMLAWKQVPNPDPAQPRPTNGAEISGVFGKLLKPLFVPLAIVSMLMGTVQVGWLLMMVAQHAADPKAIHEVRPMIPRPGYIPSEAH